jgi:hypothetical protein
MSKPRPKETTARLVVCIENKGYGVSLERRKIYVSLPDVTASRRGQIRVIDESGEDYLYPRGFFLPIKLSEMARKAVLKVA